MAQPEVWLRGPLPNIPALLQPVAHALLQAQEELETNLERFPDQLLWEQPAGVASVGFHLRHLSGVLDRLLTYARGETLSAAQLEYLRSEAAPDASSARQLLDAFAAQLEQTIAQLSTTPEASLASSRGVGRAQLPSTVLGLLFHAAEHTQRHLGQLLVTARVVQAKAQRLP